MAELNPQLPRLKENALTKPSYVVQLGALKNAAKVNEIVAKLRLSGYKGLYFIGDPFTGADNPHYGGA